MVVLTPARPCLGCGMATRYGSRCPSCAAEYKQMQGTYGPDWRILRARVLAEHPTCQEPGCTARATEVDHRLPRTRGGKDVESNLQALCHRHHSRKTVTHDGGLQR